MTNLTLRKAVYGNALIVALIIGGCGGGGSSTGGSGGGGGGGGTKLPPNAKTKSDVTSHIQAYGQGIASLSFAGFGTKFQSHVAAYDNILGLWYKTIQAPDGVQELFYQDQALTMPAGSLMYTANDIALTTSGPFSITAGRYANLSGTYNEALQTSGSNGSINFSIPNVATTVCQFIQLTNSTGGIYGTCTDAVSLQSGYAQTEQVAFNVDGTQNISATDSNTIASKANFAAKSFTSTGTITGSDPGLPATLTLDATGTGTVKFVDGTVIAVTNWLLAG